MMLPPSEESAPALQPQLPAAAVIRSTDILVLPRFFLILSLQEQLATLRHDAEVEQQPKFWTKLVKILKKLQEAVSRIAEYPKLEDGIHQAREEFDSKLVRFLQSVPGVPRILLGYLPKVGQTWDAFLEEKPEDERKLSVVELDTKEIQNELTQLFLQAIRGLLNGLTKPEDPPTSGKHMAPESSRKKPMSTGVQVVVAPPTSGMHSAPESSRKKPMSTGVQVVVAPPTSGMHSAAESSRKKPMSTGVQVVVAPPTSGMHSAPESSRKKPMSTGVQVVVAPSKRAAARPVEAPVGAAPVVETYCLEMEESPIAKVEAIPLVMHANFVKTVFYATDRKLFSEGKDKQYYGGEIREAISERPIRPAVHDAADKIEHVKVSSPLHYGVAKVSIPAIHQTGTLEMPGLLEKEDPLKHVMIVLGQDKKFYGDSAEFFRRVNIDIRKNLSDQNTTGDLMVFIHGYNVTHEAALKRAGQLKHDLHFEGTMVAYTWSSQGSLFGYSHDEKTVEKTKDSLKSFLLSIMHEVKTPTRIHLLAHSMGNRALIGALDKLHDGERPAPLPSLSQLIFAAADERPCVFEKMVQKMNKTYDPKLSSRSDSSTGNGNGSGQSCVVADYSRPFLSVYCSKEDLALKLSSLYHFKFHERRLGDSNRFSEPNELAPGVQALSLDEHDVIDASGVEFALLALHHSYFGDLPPVIQDIKMLLTERKRAKERKNLKYREGNKIYEFIAMASEKGHDLFSMLHNGSHRGCLKVDTTNTELHIEFSTTLKW